MFSWISQIRAFFLFIITRYIFPVPRGFIGKKFYWMPYRYFEKWKYFPLKRENLLICSATGYKNGEEFDCTKELLQFSPFYSELVVSDFTDADYVIFSTFEGNTFRKNSSESIA